MLVPPIGDPSRSTIHGATRTRPAVRPRLRTPGCALRPISPTKANTTPISKARVKASKSWLMNSNLKSVAASMYPARMPTAIRAAPNKETVFQTAKEWDREGMDEFYNFVALLPEVALTEVICTRSVPICRWVGPAGVGTSASFRRSFSYAARPSSTAASSASPSGIS